MPTSPTASSDGLATPSNLRGESVMDSIRRITQFLDSTNDEDEPTTKSPRYLKFTPEQLSQLIVACSTPGVAGSINHVSSRTSTATTTTNAPAYITNAKYEEICCKGIKPPYNGTEDDLMPFLLRLDIRR
jgi:hypothetical protein